MRETTLGRPANRCLLFIAAAAALAVPAPFLFADAPDFNGDGFDDLAIGIPDEDIDSDNNNCGAVHVFHGSAGGITLNGDQIWHQNQPNILDECDVDDFFGASLAWGDFDGDGFDDLAIGVPNEQPDGGDLVGAVAVLYGSPAGLRAVRNQLWSQSSPGIADEPEQNDSFGQSLAAGDFDGDGFDDLAVGVPEESINGMNIAGALHIIFGSATGLRGAGSQFLHQDVSGVEDTAEAGDVFATSLTAGDFNGDGRDDLAVGVQLEDIGAIVDGGAVQVFYGSGSGLRVSNDQFWHQDVPGIADRAEPGDHFGENCAAGDFNGDGFDDLAIGIEDEDIELLSDAGAVHILYGSTSGLTAAGDQFLHQDTPGIAERAEAGDRFADDLIAGDFDGDGFDDLAIGIEDESVAGVEQAGAVAILSGGRHGLRTEGDAFLHQDVPGIPDTNDEGDSWGGEVASGDFNGDGFDDLAVGAPNENLPLLHGQSITRMVVRLNDVAHTFPDDFDVLLVGPGGENLILMSDAGGDTDSDNVNLVFFDDAPTRIPDQGPLVSGVFKPTNIDDGAADAFPAPAPAPSSARKLSTFNGTDPVGRWRLFIVDDKANDVGALDGWSISLDGIGFYSSANNSSIAVPAVGTSGPASRYPSTITIPRDAMQDAGALTILFGSPSGMSTDGCQFLHQSTTAEIENKAEAFDRFGEVM
jgi:hypothetical protein